MARLTIETALSENQMNKAIAHARTFIHQNKDTLDTVTFEYLFQNVNVEGRTHDIQLEAEFVSYLDTIEIKQEKQYFNALNAEVYSEGLTFQCDTMVFQQLLQFLLDEINDKHAQNTVEDEQEHYKHIALSYAG